MASRCLETEMKVCDFVTTVVGFVGFDHERSDRLSVFKVPFSSTHCKSIGRLASHPSWAEWPIVSILVREVGGGHIHRRNKWLIS